MGRVPFVRFAAAFTGAAALLTAVAVQPAPPSATSADPELASSWVPPNPTNAAKIFRWGNKQWGDEFVTPLQSMWRPSRPAMVRDQHGMLTLDAPAGAPKNVIVTLLNHNRQYGRWEARVRSRQYGTSGTPYTLYWELVPRTGGYHCEAHNLMLATYPLGTNTATMHLRKLPDTDFSAGVNTPLSDNEFHTYAVEVTRDHVSWFVDTKVIRTERRAAALSAENYAMRFRLMGQPGAQMRQGRMQMDWARYYTLERPNAKSIEAPQLTQGTYAGAC
jgi:glycosyl hydrolase family 16